MPEPIIINSGGDDTEAVIVLFIILFGILAFAYWYLKIRPKTEIASSPIIMVQSTQTTTTSSSPQITQSVETPKSTTPASTNNITPAPVSSKGNIDYVFYWYPGMGDAPQSSLSNLPANTTHVILSFLISDARYQKGSFDLSKTGIEGLDTVPDLRKAVLDLRAKNITPMLSLGGWAYSAEDWKFPWKFSKETAVAIKNLMDDYGFMGVDIDYEKDDDKYETNLKQIITELNAVGITDIRVTIMAYLTERTKKAIGSSNVTAIQLMTYGVREDQSVQQKRDAFKKCDSDPFFDKMGVSQGYASGGLKSENYVELGKDVKARASGGKRAGVFLWGNTDAFKNLILPL